jgi:hypothetical protein
MSLIAKDKGGTDYEPLAAGMHHAICYGIVDLGTQPGGQFEPKRKVAFLWEVPAERIKFEKDGVKKDLPRGVSAIYTLSLSTKGLMRPMLESWRGRAFTAEELNGFDLKTILGANCFLNIVHVQGTGKNVGKTFANVKSVNPLAKGMEKKKSENPLVFFSIDECKGETITVPAGVPDWLKGKILQSEECIREQCQNGQPDPTEEQTANRGSGNLDEDVPF